MSRIVAHVRRAFDTVTAVECGEPSPGRVIDDPATEGGADVCPACAAAFRSRQQSWLDRIGADMNRRYGARGARKRK